MRLSRLYTFLLLSLLDFACADGSCSDADRRTITTLRAGRFATSPGSECACSILGVIFKDRIFFPGSAVFTVQATRYYDRREALTPRCVFVPLTSNDVAKGVVVLSTCQSQFAVRGGGHMPVAGAANTNGGVLLTLNNFTDIGISQDLSAVEVGAGLNWYQVYSFLEPYGRIAIGGRLKTIGVPGLTLGGGISYFTSKYGFAMDNVLAYEIVTASGNVVRATATRYTDLFWALKGGGSNFGIVTKFTLATYEIPTVSTAIQVFSESNIPEFIGAVANLANFQDEVDTSAGGIFTIDTTPSTGLFTAAFQGVQAGSVVNPVVFANFTTIPSQYSAYNVTTLAQWCSTLDTPFQQFRNLYGMHVVLADNESLQAMYATFKAAVPALANITGLDTNLVFQPMPKSATRVAKTNGIGNTWGLDDSKAYIFWIIATQWLNASDDATVMAWSTALVKQLHATNLKAGVGVDIMYVNDCSDSQKPYEGLPPANLARLKEIRAEYDFTLVFRDLSSGGFKLD